MSGPLYGCSNIGCAEECSYPADMLRVYEGKPYCGGCWDYAPLAYAPGIDPDDEDVEPLRWYELEPFVPEHERRISELEATICRISGGESMGRIALLEAVAEAAEFLIQKIYSPMQKGWLTESESELWYALRAAGYLGGGDE